MSFRARLKSAMQSAWNSAEGQRLASQIKAVAQDYGNCLYEAWSDGSISKDEIRECLEKTKFRDNMKSVWLNA